MSTSNGDKVSYNHLVLCPGTKPKKIPVDGSNLDGVLTLRTIGDTKKITSAVTKESEIVIIGTSFIGMEVSMALLKKEPKSVTLVGMDEVPFEAILGKDIGIAIMEVSELLELKLTLLEHEETRHKILHESWCREDHPSRWVALIDDAFVIPYDYQT